jgi:hypothetical protein
MNAEHKAKLAAGRTANNARFASQVISIDENWQIRRADQWNWEIRQKVNGNWRFIGFYGKLNAALMALPAHMLGQDAQNSLAACIDCLNSIKYSIQSALPQAKRIEETKP